MRTWVALALTLAACSGPTEEADKGEVPVAHTGPVVGYRGRSESLAKPILEHASAELGLEIEVQYGSTPDLVSRFLTEGAESPADVVFAQDPGFLGVLSEREALAPLSEQTLGLVDARFRDPAGRWLGTSGRLRVLVVDTSSVPEAKRPTSLKDLADPKWKGKLGWAPSNSSFQAHLSGLRHAWGEDETRTWLQGVMANAPTRYPKNSPQVEAADTGAIAIGWVNHYYLHRRPKEGRRAANWSFPEAGREGNVLMVSGAGVRSGSPRAADAEKVVAWLASEQAQQKFATENYEYPTRPGVAAHPDLQPLSEVPLAEIQQSHLSDLAPTRTLLEELGLL